MLALLFSFRGRINRMMFLLGSILQAMLFYLGTILVAFFALPLTASFLIAAPLISLWITLSLYIKRYRDIGVPWFITLVLVGVPWLVSYLVPALILAAMLNAHLLLSFKESIGSAQRGFLILCAYLIYVSMIYLFIPLLWPGRKQKYGLYG